MSSTNTNMATPTCENCGRDKTPTYICDACCSKLNAASRAKREQIAALEAERDELRRRLDAVVTILKPSQNPECWDVVRPIYVRACAIAEGRDNG